MSSPSYGNVPRQHTAVHQVQAYEVLETDQSLLTSGRFDLEQQQGGFSNRGLSNPVTRSLRAYVCRFCQVG
eukprot:2364037-Amphidinium_carterae.1